MSNFVNRFVFLPFFFSKKKIKQTGCIIMYLHSASRLADKFTYAFKMCVCVRAPVCVYACVLCTHVRALIHVFDHCGYMCAPESVYPHICGMDVSILACISSCVFLFSRHIHDTKLELFSVWLVCHVFSEFDSCKNFKLNKR